MNASSTQLEQNHDRAKGQHVYLCPRCGFYHVGQHSPQQKRREEYLRRMLLAHLKEKNR